MLEIKNVHKTFGKSEVLKGVNLSISKGDVVVILGPSGSGKTTLLRCINFLERADQGQAVFGNMNVNLKQLLKNKFMRSGKRLRLFFKIIIFLIIKQH